MRFERPHTFFGNRTANPKEGKNTTGGWLWNRWRAGTVVTGCSIKPQESSHGSVRGAPATVGEKEIEMDDTNNSEARDVLVVGLKNAHAMEKQALAIMGPQIERIENYPEVRQRLEQHVVETEGQITRLEGVLDQLGEKASGFKDTVLSTVGGHSSTRARPRWGRDPKELVGQLRVREL
jgi:hypothetical protein